VTSQQTVPRTVGDDSQRSDWPVAALSPWSQMSPLLALAPFMRQLEEAMSSSRAMAPALSIARTAVDVRETPEEFVFVADVPGIANKSGVNVVVQDNVLTISGERRFETASDEDEPKAGEDKPVHHRVERSFGRFVRSFQLPRHADGDKVKATVASGVLTVRVPKKEVPPHEQMGGQVPIDWKEL